MLQTFEKESKLTAVQFVPNTHRATDVEQQAQYDQGGLSGMSPLPIALPNEKNLKPLLHDLDWFVPVAHF